MNLTAIAEGKVYYAPWTDNRKLDFRCPGCGASMILKKGSIKYPHFAHEAHSVCEISGETLEHLKAKTFMYMGLKNNPGVEIVEAECMRFEGIRPDIAFKPYGMKRWIGFEFQRSGISTEDIWDRCFRYEKAGVYLLWVTTEQMYKKIIKSADMDYPEVRLSEAAKLFMKLHGALVTFSGDGLVAFTFNYAKREREFYSYDGPTGEFYTETLKSTFVPRYYKKLNAIDLQTKVSDHLMEPGNIESFVQLGCLIQIARRNWDDFDYFSEQRLFWEGGEAS